MLSPTVLGVTTWALPWSLLEFLVCIWRCVLFNFLWVFPFVTQEESVTLGSDPESCDVWLCAISFTSVAFLMVLSLPESERKTKPSSPPGFWHLSKAPTSFGGNECSESWTHFPGAPWLCVLSGACRPGDVKWGSSGAWCKPGWGACLQSLPLPFLCPP